MRNEVDSRFLFLVVQMRNGKWVPLPISYFSFVKLETKLTVHPLIFSPFSILPFLIGKTCNWKWEMGRFLISHLQKSKWEMGNRSISHFSFAEIEMGNEKWGWFPFPILSCANEKWEMGCFTHFLFRIRQIGNWINGIFPDCLPLASF